MTFALAWFVFPLVLAVLSLGCGLLLECGSGLGTPATATPAGWIRRHVARDPVRPHE